MAVEFVDLFALLWDNCFYAIYSFKGGDFFMTIAFITPTDKVQLREERGVRQQLDSELSVLQ